MPLSYDVECIIIRISLAFRRFPRYFFHSNFNQANLSSQACKDVYHLNKCPRQALMASTTKVALYTVSHNVVVSNYSKASITSIWDS